MVFDSYVHRQGKVSGARFWFHVFSIFTISMKDSHLPCKLPKDTLIKVVIV